MMNCIRGGRYNNGTDKFVLVNVILFLVGFFKQSKQEKTTQ